MEQETSIKLENINCKGIETTNTPGKRSSFGLCCNNNIIYIFGGWDGRKHYDDLWYININDINKILKWNKINKQIISPNKRYGCTLNYYNNKLYLFGGWNYDDRYLNDLWEYNINQNKWNKININNIIPNKVSNHKTVIYKNNLIIFGGIDSNEYFNDLYIINLNEYKSYKINCINKPKKRVYHGMTISQNKLIIYGGFDEDINELNDIYLIDIKSIINDINKQHKWININNNNNIPLYGHSLLSYNNKIIIVAGQDSSYKYNSDLIIYNDINSIKKKIIYNIKDNKYKRHNHESCLLNVNNKIYVFMFGGYNDKDRLNDSILLYLFNDNNNMDDIKSNDILNQNTNRNELKSEINSLKTKLMKQESEHKHTIKDIINNYEHKIDIIKGEYIIKMEQMRIKYEEKIDDIKQQNNDNNNDTFKAYYTQKFGDIFLKYYDNILLNELNNIDIIKLLTKNDLIQYNIIKNTFHQKQFISIINDIQIERNEFIKYLKKLKIHYKYINILNNKGIYTFIEFNDNFNDYNQLNNILNNINVSKKIFNNLPNNNNNDNNVEGKLTQQF